MGFLRRPRERSNDAVSGHQGEMASVYRGLRDRILTLDPSSVGVTRTPDLPNIWGVVMDWGMEKAVATIVSLADGTTSLYLSTGGGSLGAGAHPAAATASTNAIRVAESVIEDFPTASDAPIPVQGRTALTLLTFSGLRRLEADNGAFSDGSSKGSAVANAMQQVIYEIRRAEAASQG
jgi:hypothetical protein